MSTRSGDDELGQRWDLPLTLIEAFVEPLAALDLNLNVILFNQGARDLAPELTVGKRGSLCCSLGASAPGLCSTLTTRCPTRRALREGRACSAKQLLERGGPRRTFEIQATPLRNSRGSTVGVLQVVRDITEAAQREEILSRARNEWLTTADSVSELIILTDMDGRIVRCNRATRDFVKRDYSDLIGQQLAAVFKHLKCDTSTLDAGEGEMHCENPRGILQVASYPANVSSGRYGTVWVLRDVGAVRRLEAVAASVDMMNNLGHVLGTVRHELGNPINAIKTALTVLRDRGAGFSPEKRMEYVHRCLDDVGRVQELLENLRTFNMFDAVRCEPTDLASLLLPLSELVRDQLREQRIAFEVRLSKDNCGAVRADPRALRQVLLGLIANAAAAVAETKHPRVVLEAEREGGAARVSVLDNGTGMSPADLKMAFVPLYTTKRQGTGLGLSIARNLVTRMNGTIELRSQVGRGTRAEVVLECARTGVGRP